MPRISITFLLVILSTAAWAQFEHPDLKSGKAVVKNVVIVPPNVTPPSVPAHSMITLAAARMPLSVLMRFCAIPAVTTWH